MLQYLRLLDETSRQNWNQPSLSDFGGQSFTYSDVRQHIARLHLLFKAAGINKGDKVAIAARNSARWAISFLASNTYKTVTVPILADFTPAGMAGLVDHSESLVLFTDPDIWAKLDVKLMPGLRIAINLKDFSLLFAADELAQSAFDGLDDEFQKTYPLGVGPKDCPFPEIDPDELALINYTSGTTSAPKGVMLTYGNLDSTVDFSWAHVQPAKGATIVSMLPLAHMYGLGIEFLFPTCTGAAVYFLGKTPSPTLLLKAMAQVRPFMVVTVPLVMEKVYQSSIRPVLSKWYMKVLLAIPGISHIIYNKVEQKVAQAFGGRVDYFIMGGAALNPEVERCFRKMKLPFTIGYGMTEASPLLGWESPQLFVPGSCGKPCHQVMIDSEDPQHIPGEILVKGPNITIGYYKNPEANEAAFTKDGWLRTGDLGVMDKDRNMFIRGRSKNMILSANGQNIYPEELEAVLNNQPYVAESLVVDRGGKLTALVFPNEDSIKKDGLDETSVKELPEKIRTFVNRLLPSYSRISKVEMQDKPFEKTPKMSIRRFLYK